MNELTHACYARANSGLTGMTSWFSIEGYAVMDSSFAARPNKEPSASAPTRHEITNPDATTTGAWQPEMSLYSDGAFPGVDQPVLAPVGSAL